MSTKMFRNKRWVKVTLAILLAFIVLLLSAWLLSLLVTFIDKLVDF